MASGNRGRMRSPACCGRPAPGGRSIRTAEAAPETAPATRARPAPGHRGEPSGLSPVGPAVPGAGRVHDRVRQRSRTPPPAPHHQPRASGHGDGTGWCRWPCGRTACATSPTSPSRRRTRDPRPHRDQPGRHAPLGLHHHRRRRRACCPSPSSTSGKRGCPSRSAPTCCASWLRRDQAARPPATYRHLQGGCQLGVGQPDPGSPDGEEPDPAAGRGRVVWLRCPQGLEAQRRYHEVVGTIERRWRQRFSGGAVAGLRASLEPLAIAPDGEPPPLLGGLEPYPDNWRAALRRPVTLPHYPMVLHRGGYPDGS